MEHIPEPESFGRKQWLTCHIYIANVLRVGGLRIYKSRHKQPHPPPSPAPHSQRESGAGMGEARGQGSDAAHIWVPLPSAWRQRLCSESVSASDESLLAKLAIPLATLTLSSTPLRDSMPYGSS
ncbi:unnamed protein product [Merluccius merluccius]